MSKILDIDETTLKVLGLYTAGYNREFHIREICRYLPISHGSAQNILHDLEKKRVLESETRGKTRIFRIKKSTIMPEYFLLAEIYKKICFMERDPFTAEILERVGASCTGILLLFGSYARGTNLPDSDIDLLVTGTVDHAAITRLEADFGIEINIQETAAGIFRAKPVENPLIAEVMSCHIAWMGAEEYVRMAVPV